MSLKDKLKLLFILLLPFVFVWYSLTAVIITYVECTTFTMKAWLDNMFNWEHFIAYSLGMLFILVIIASLNYVIRIITKKIIG